MSPKSSWNQAQMFASAKTSDDNEKRDDWATPPTLFDLVDAEFEFGVDVCALATNKKVLDYVGPDHPDMHLQNAFNVDWSYVSRGKPAWCNPPYSRAGAFLELGRWHAINKDLVSCHLVFARTDTKWWWETVLGRDHITGERMVDEDGYPTLCAAEIRWHPGRIYFIDPLTGMPRMNVDKKGVERPTSAPAPSVLIVFRPDYHEEWPENGILHKTAIEGVAPGDDP